MRASCWTLHVSQVEALTTVTIAARLNDSLRGCASVHYRHSHLVWTCFCCGRLLRIIRTTARLARVSLLDELVFENTSTSLKSAEHIQNGPTLNNDSLLDSFDIHQAHMFCSVLSRGTTTASGLEDRLAKSLSLGHQRSFYGRIGVCQWESWYKMGSCNWESCNRP
jgi:hypothetical protein